jgi:hypothetical protein
MTVAIAKSRKEAEELGESIVTLKEKKHAIY